jgi:hypothetical protein
MEGRIDDRQQHQWMGRLDLHLLDQWNQTVAWIEFSVRDELISVWHGNRTLSVMDRARFHAWFWNPIGPHETDDLVWSVRGTRLALSIDGSGHYFIPAVFVNRLASVI